MSRKKMWLGTQHHAQWVDCPLRGADMSPEGWGADGTYLSGGGFVRQSQDSHRQYIFEWTGASSRESAEVMQAYRDGVYSKTRSDLIYFIDPLIYSRNILPKRWAQPGILAPDSGTTLTPLGTVSKIDGPGFLGLPLSGAQVSGYFTSVAQFNATTTPQAGSIWMPVPLGETLHLVAWTGDFATQESGLYVKVQNLDGTWRPAERVEGLGVKVTGARGVLLASVGMFNYFGARAVIGQGDGWADPAEYAWTGTPNASTSTRTTVDGTVTNLFTNPNNGSSGEAVVWENLWTDPLFTHDTTGGSSPWGRFQRVNVTSSNGVLSITRTSLGGASRVQAYPNLTAAVGVGEYVTVRVRRVEGQPISAGSAAGVLSLQWYNDALSQEEGPELRYASDLTGQEVTMTLTIQRPSEEAARLAIRLNSGGEEGDTVRWRDPQVMVGEKIPVDFFVPGEPSPDSDLTPQWSGSPNSSTSHLVGQKVSGFTGANCEVIQSSQWPGRETTARLIVNRDSDGYSGRSFAWFNPGEEARTGVVEVYLQDEVSYGSDGGQLNRFSPRVGDTAGTSPGEYLLRSDWSGEAFSAQVVRMGGPDVIGQSLWFDRLTTTDTEEYEGPPFSGSSPDEGPEWLPGLGHSGCRFVGNPTWIANTGVHGGQIGYAATLKEVGDWQ